MQYAAPEKASEIPKLPEVASTPSPALVVAVASYIIRMCRLFKIAKFLLPSGMQFFK